VSVPPAGPTREAATRSPAPAGRSGWSGSSPRGRGVRPAVLLLHGLDGLQYRGAAYREAARHLARNGYAALLVHYVIGDSTLLFLRKHLAG
jgi:dienelactone hydrolase